VAGSARAGSAQLARRSTGPQAITSFFELIFLCEQNSLRLKSFILNIINQKLKKVILLNRPSFCHSEKNSTRLLQKGIFGKSNFSLMVQGSFCLNAIFLEQIRFFNRNLFYV
jgi:hypothetical protein